MNLIKKKDIIFAILIFLISFIFFFNFLHFPDPRSWRDEGQFFYGAERILSGQLIYKDFHEIQFPGSFYLLAGVFSIFGSTFEAGRVFTYLLVSFAIAIYFLISKTFIRSLYFSLIPTFFITFFGFLQWTGSLPHWFSFFTNSLTLLFGYIFVCNLRKIFLILAGLFAGFTFLIIQNEGFFLLSGILFFLLIFSYIKSNGNLIKKILFFSIPPVIILSTIFIVFIFKESAYEFIYSTFLYLFDKYISAHKTPYFGYFTIIIIKDILRQIGQIHGFPGLLFKIYGYLVIFLYFLLQYGLIIIYVFSIVQLIKNYKYKENIYYHTQLYLTITGIALFLSQIHRPDPIKMVFVCMPALILMMKMMEDLKKIPRALVNSSLILISFTIFAYAGIRLYNFKVDYICEINAPGGKIYFDNRIMCEELNQLNYFFSNLKDGKKKVYIHNWAQQYYFLFKLKSPVRVDGLLMGHNSMRQFEESLKILEEESPEYVLTDKVLDFILRHPENSPFPTFDPELLKKDPIWEFIRANYIEIAFFPASGLTLWRRK